MDLKTEVEVRAAVVYEGQVVKATLPGEASIYTAKMYALNMTVDITLEKLSYFRTPITLCSN